MKKMLWPLFFGLMILKYGYHGFKYYPILDDWIQYGSYSLQDNIFTDVILKSATYATRPIASFSDPYIWARFWPNLGVPFFVITVLHALSAYFLHKVIEYFKLPVGLPFLIIYGLLPLGTEGTYWISASSRLVAGVFFMSLALFLWTKYMENIQWRYLIGFSVIHLVSMGYYEQVSALSAFLGVVVILASFKKVKNKWVVAIPILNFFLMLVYYKIFGNTGNLAQRGQFVSSGIVEHLIEGIRQSLYVFGSVQVKLMQNGFVRGLNLLIQDKSIFYFALIVGLSGLAGVVHFRTYVASRLNKAIFSIVSGGILVWVPLSVSLVLAVLWISNRNVFTSFIGLALVVEGIWMLGFHGKLGRSVKSIFLSLMVFVFLVVNVSEIDDYKIASEIDREVAVNILEHMGSPEIQSGERRVMVFGGESYYMEQNSYHNDHINNVTTSDWAMTGAVRAVSENLKLKNLIMHAWAGGPMFISDEAWTSSLILGITPEREIVELSVKQVTATFTELYTTEGVLFGLVEKTNESDRYYFHVK